MGVEELKAEVKSEVAEAAKSIRDEVAKSTSGVVDSVKSAVRWLVGLVVVICGALAAMATALALAIRRLGVLKNEIEKLSGNAKSPQAN